MLLGHIELHHFIVYIFLGIKNYYKNPDGGFRVSLSLSIYLYSLFEALKHTWICGRYGSLLNKLRYNYVLVRKENGVP